MLKKRMAKVFHLKICRNQYLPILLNIASFLYFLLDNLGIEKNTKIIYFKIKLKRGICWKDTITHVVPAKCSLCWWIEKYGGLIWSFCPGNPQRKAGEKKDICSYECSSLA